MRTAPQHNWRSSGGQGSQAGLEKAWREAFAVP
jgi:hypothetical protein